MDNKRILQYLTILNWNANGIKSKRSIFIEFLTRYNIDIACITETHLTNDEPFRIPGYHIYRYDRVNRTASGGAAIIIKKRLVHQPLATPNFNNLEAVGIIVNDAINIISTYKQPNKPLLECDVRQIFSNDSTATLMIGDLNCKNTIWGCRANNPNGIKLHSLSELYGYQVLAPEENTHVPYRSDHQPDILDIIISKNVNNPIYQQVLNELDSDHLPVLIKFNMQPEINTIPPRLITGKINWEKFQSSLEKYCDYTEHFLTSDEVDTAITKFNTSIVTAVAEASTPTRPKNRSAHLTPPIRIANLIKEKNSKRREWQRTRNPLVKTQLNNLTHKVKWELDNLRIQRYKQYIEDLEPGDPGMWKATKRILRQQETMPTLKDDQQTYTSDTEKCELFSNHLRRVFNHSSDHVVPSFTQNIENYVETNMPVTTETVEATTVSEVQAIIANISIKKAPGHDLIPNIILKHLTDKALRLLVTIMNACLSIGYFPNIWKQAIILLFHKPGKDKYKKESYRPISLLPALSKLLEKVIHQRLCNEIAEKEVIPPIQFGFRKGHSASHQLLRLTEMIERGFESKKYSVVAFLDVAQAFDRIWINGLKYKILRLDIPEYLKAILLSFLDKRTFRVRIASAMSKVTEINAGVPQGSILGPVLFNIFVHDIPVPENSTLAMFADDTAIITQNEDLRAALTQLQDSINSLQRWFNKWRIILNQTKCEAKIFTLRRFSSQPCLSINNQPIKWKTKDQAVKYLGVHLDTRLTWSLHINFRLNLAHTRLRLLYPILNRTSPLRLQCALLIYQSLLRSMLTYACGVWSNTSRTNIRKLQSFQNKVLRIALKAPWFVRNEQIHRDLHFPTIDEFLKKATRNFISSLHHCTSAVHHNIGQKNIHVRLKRQLPQDMCDTSSYPE